MRIASPPLCRPWSGETRNVESPPHAAARIDPSSTSLRTLASLQHVAAPEVGTDLAERLLLQLPDALARERVLLADLLERELVVGLEPEPLAQDVGLDRTQPRDHFADLLRERVGLHRFAGRLALV